MPHLFPEPPASPNGPRFSPAALARILRDVEADGLPLSDSAMRASEQILKCRRDADWANELETAHIDRMLLARGQACPHLESLLQRAMTPFKPK